MSNTKAPKAQPKVALITGITGWTAAELGVQIRWEGSGVNEKGYWVNFPPPMAERAENRQPCIISIDPRYFRSAEVEILLGDPSKAKSKLGWVPEITAQEMCGSNNGGQI